MLRIRFRSRRLFVYGLSSICRKFSSCKIAENNVQLEFDQFKYKSSILRYMQNRIGLSISISLSLAYIATVIVSKVCIYH